ncbi:hypothetical protein OQA88_6591 [Cercophora sp. LCS_1]
MAPRLSAALFLVAAAVSPCQAAIAAWWNGIAPQILIQNADSSDIRHSACNQFGTPAYSPSDKKYVLPLNIKAKQGTPLAGVGYWNEMTTIASIYYIEVGGAVANILVECEMKTGIFRNTGNRIVSDDETTVHQNTSLAAVLLGASGGYRAYFHDENMAINELGYTKDGGWEYRGIVSPDHQQWPALGAAFTGSQNITVASARDNENIETTRFFSDQTWHITTLPRPLEGNLTTHQANVSEIAINATATVNFTLPAWNGKPGALGVSIDSSYTRSVWYIGNDSALYSVRNKDGAWGLSPNQSTAFWPTADGPNAEFGIASDFRSSMVRLYYFVKGQLAEVKYESGAWKAWSAVATPTPVSTDTPGSSGPDSSETEAASTGLSTGAKAGVGVGVALGIIALGALGAAFFLIRKRNKSAAGGTQQPPPASLDHPSPVPPYGSPGQSPDSANYDHYMWEKKHAGVAPYPQAVYAPVQLDAPSRPMELAAPQPMYELPDQTYSHELVADNNPRPAVPPKH